MPRNTFALRLIGAFSLFSAASLANGEDLVTMMDQALSADTRIKISEFEAKISDEQDWQALGRLLPQLSAFGQFSHNERSDNADTDSYRGEKYSVSMSQVVFNFDAFNNKIRTARVLDQSNYVTQDVIGTVLLDVTEKYLQVLGTRDSLALVQAEKESVQGQLDRYEKLYEKGLIKVTDLLDARVRRDTIQADEIEILNSVEVAREALVKMTGKSVGTLDPLRAQSEFPKVEGAVEDWITKAQNTNPALLAQRMGVLAAEAGARQAYGSYMPRVELQLNHQKSDVGFENSQTAQTDTNYIALNVSVPLFAGGSNYFRIREARTRVQLEQMREEEQMRELMRGTREAYLNARSNERRIQASERRLSSAQKSYQAMQESFKYSAVTVVDVLDALQAEFSARRDLLNAKYAYLLAWLQLHYLAGELTPEQIHVMNNLLAPTP